MFADERPDESEPIFEDGFSGGLEADWHELLDIGKKFKAVPCGTETDDLEDLNRRSVRLSEAEQHMSEYIDRFTWLLRDTEDGRETRTRHFLDWRIPDTPEERNTAPRIHTAREVSTVAHFEMADEVSTVPEVHIAVVDNAISPSNLLQLAPFDENRSGPGAA